MRTGAEVRLRSTEGVWRGAIRRASARPKRSTPPQADVIADELDRLARKFAKRVRKGVPRRRSDGRDDAVHDLRTATRRLLAHLLALKPLGDRRLRTAIRRVEKVLGWTGSLRDAVVEEEHLKGMRVPAKALPGLLQELRKGGGRRARRLNRHLEGVGTGGIRRDLRRVGRRIRKLDAEIPRVVARAFGRIRQAREVLDAADPDTLHELRISIKHFRYLMETLQPTLPGVPSSSVQALHELQTTLGDLHDLDLLSSDLSARVRKHPDRAPGQAKILERLEQKRSTLYRSFLKAVDPILQHWEEAVSGLDRAR